MKKKLSKIAGLTLIEILIAIVISSLMMIEMFTSCLLYTSPSPRDDKTSRMPSSA